MLRSLGEAAEKGHLAERLDELGLDAVARENGEDFLRRQIGATGALPDDRTILLEHFRDRNGSGLLMVHGVFGRRVNAPLSLLVQEEARKRFGINVGCVDEEDGFLLYPYGEESIPEGLLCGIETEGVRGTLEALLPVTPVFSMAFRYNAARALMMGMRSNGRQPLWMQRLRSTEMLDSLIREKEHPLIRETRRECLEDNWDIEGVLYVLNGIRSGLIHIREIHTDVPSPMSLPLQWQVEAAQMYEYTPVTEGIRRAVYDELAWKDRMKPSREELDIVRAKKKPEDEKQLYSLLVMEGDLTGEEVRELSLEEAGPVPSAEGGQDSLTGQDEHGGQSEGGVPGGALLAWLENLTESGMTAYIEPGLWIAAEQREEYEAALDGGDSEAAAHLVRRLLFYRGAQTEEQICARYCFQRDFLTGIMDRLSDEKSVVKDGKLYYHAKIYAKAGRNMVRSLRGQVRTQSPERFAALAARQVIYSAPSAEQLERAVKELAGCLCPAEVWEDVVFPRRVKNYSGAMLDRLLAGGDYFWQLKSGSLCFYRTEDVDWEAGFPREAEALEGDERILYEELCRRGASFLKSLSRVLENGDPRETLLALAEKGLVCADSFVPVRQWLNRDKIKKSAVRQRVNVRVAALSAGRWDVVRPLRVPAPEERLDRLFDRNRILCRETFRRSEAAAGPLEAGSFAGWPQVLELLRVQEYTGQVRRGYFISGLSGAQFVRSSDYEAVTRALEIPEEEILWLSGADPAQLWGRVLPGGPGFLNVPGTAAALRQGRTEAVFERRGKVLRVFEEEKLPELLERFVQDFSAGILFAGQKRITVKEYPSGAAEALQQAGFQKEMQDYVLYR